MLTFFKWLAGTALMLVLLIVIAALVLPRLIDPNDYRDDIAQLVAERTGRELSIDGDLQISVFPWLGVRTQGLRFSQPAAIGGELIQVEQAQLRVKLLPLLSKRLEVDTIILESPSIRLVTLADGSDSFTGLFDKQGAAQDKPALNNSSASVALVVQGLQLSDASIVMDNRQTGSITEIEQVNLDSGNLLTEQFADLTASGVLKGQSGSVDTSFALSAQAQIDAQSGQIKAEKIQLETKQAEQLTQLTIERVDFNQAQLLQVEGVSAKVQGLTDSSLALSLQVPSVSANLADYTADFSTAKLSWGELRARVENLRLTDLAEQPRVSANVFIENVNAADLLPLLGDDEQAEDDQVLPAIGARFSLRGTTERVELAAIELNIDQSLLRGALTMSNFMGDSERAKLGFDLSLDKLNLDQYLPPEAEQTTQAAQSSGAAQALFAPLFAPLVAFEGLDTEGRLRAEQLSVSGVTLQNIDVQLTSVAGQVRITPRADLYQGALDGQIAFHQRDQTAQLKIDQQIELVALGELLSDAELSDQLSGIGSLLVDLLVTQTADTTNNQGQITLSAKDGVIRGVDLEKIVNQSYASYKRLQGRSVADVQGQAEQADQTEFDSLQATFELNDSVLKNNDLRLSAPLFSLTGAGRIDLQQQSLNYLLQFSLRKQAQQEQSSEAFEKLAGIILPIRLSGDLAAPDYSLDVQALSKSLFKQELNQKKAELLERETGIEGGQELSTKQVLKQLLINKALEKDKPASSTPPASETSAPQPPVEQSESESPAATQQSPEKTKEQAKDELKRKLLESLLE